jgi:hypothetical protein
MKYDSLESDDDLELLFEVLKKVKDFRGEYAKLTANCLVANPDFSLIKLNDFKEYFYEDVSRTFQRYSNSNNCLNLWRTGYEKGIFVPQSHGREHLNISRWMRDLQNGDDEVHYLFNLESFGLSKTISKRNRGSYLAAFDGSKNELLYRRDIIVKEALDLFQKHLGYRSHSFISPNYVWDSTIEDSLFQNGVRFIQTQRANVVSRDFGSKKVIKRHYTGQKNHNMQIYMVRNCEFEPSMSPDYDWVNHCLQQINNAFKMHKPAIISTHRVNFIGSLDISNRARNLVLFKKLLNNILKEWSTVEFLSSDQLGHLIENT